MKTDAAKKNIQHNGNDRTGIKNAIKVRAVAVFVDAKDRKCKCKTYGCLSRQHAIPVATRVRTWNPHLEPDGKRAPAVST